MDGIVSFISLLIIGALIGWISGELWVGHGFGLFGDILLGIMGSILGGFLCSWFFGASGIAGLISSVLDAIVFFNHSRINQMIA